MQLMDILQIENCAKRVVISVNINDGRAPEYSRGEAQEVLPKVAEVLRKVCALAMEIF